MNEYGKNTASTEMTKDIMERCVDTLMRTRRLDEITGVMDNKTFDILLDEVCKQKWEKYRNMSKREIAIMMFKEMFDD